MGRSRELLADDALTFQTRAWYTLSMLQKLGSVSIRSSPSIQFTPQASSKREH